MNDQYWNYIVTFVGLIGFYLGGKKIWWAWYVNIANQILWLTFGLVTAQWGFVVGTFFYTPVFVRNAYLWTKEHREEKKPTPRDMQFMSIGLDLKPNFELKPNQSWPGVRWSFSEAALSQLEYEVLPWWKRWLRKKPAIKNRPGGVKIGEVKKIEQRDDGLYLTGSIDRSTIEGEEAWDKIAGPLPRVSIDEQKPCKGKNVNICVAEGCYNEDCLKLIASKTTH